MVAEHQKQLDDLEADLIAKGYQVKEGSDWEQVANTVYGRLFTHSDISNLICAFRDVEKEKTFIKEDNTRAASPVGQRVKVKSGDGTTELGFGTYIGEADVQVVFMRDGSLRSMKDAEEGFDPADIPEGGIVKNIGKNPKIKLDSGEIVYGCQVWWEPA